MGTMMKFNQLIRVAAGADKSAMGAMNRPLPRLRSPYQSIVAANVRGI
jgi:hypothetical protein